MTDIGTLVPFLLEQTFHNVATYITFSSIFSRLADFPIELVTK
jgi:hypothetical protein